MDSRLATMVHKDTIGSRGLTLTPPRSIVVAMPLVIRLVAALCLCTSALVPSRGAPAAGDVRVFPNPARDVVHIAFASAVPDSIIVPNYQLRVTVHNAAGRLLRKLRDGRVDFGAGDHGEIAWDGRTSSGRRVPSGFYYIRIVRNGQVSATKVWYIW